MIRSVYRSHEGILRTDLGSQDYCAALADKHGLLWVDFLGEPPEVCEPILIQTFGFHPLAVDDALQETHIPKLDDWDQYLYIALNAVVFDRDDGVHVDTHEVDVFLGENYVVTHHDQPIAGLERIYATSRRMENNLKFDCDHLLYRLADELVVDYMRLVEELDGEIESVEDLIFDNPTTEVLERTFALKRAILDLRRTLSPEREVLNKLARDEYAVIDARDRVYFRDVYDHLVRLHDITESLRDLIGNVLDNYLSVINNRMNDIMKTLTVITTIFMPISFIAGFFGMNFFQPVAKSLIPWTGIPAFMVMLLIVMLVPGGMFFWIRKRGWM
ncbi:MAG: magnesium/cobalt transporter CorA [Omnitrophica WOR_2 bacterium]